MTAIGHTKSSSSIDSIMKKAVCSFITVIAILCSCDKSAFTSDDGDTEHVKPGLNGWYAEDLGIPSFIVTATESIRSFTLYSNGRNYGKSAFFLTREDFIDSDGKINLNPLYSSNRKSGIVETFSRTSTYPETESIESLKDYSYLYPSFYQIMDNNSVIYYLGELYSADSPKIQGKTVAYRIDGGPVFGELVYCVEQSSRYSFETDGKTLLVSNGDTFTVAGTTLIKNGGSAHLSKFNETYLHTTDWSIEAWKKEENYKKVCAGFCGWMDAVVSSYSEDWFKYISASPIPVTRLKVTIDADKSLSSIGKKVSYGWDLRMDITNQEYQWEESGTSAEMPAGGMINSLNWDSDALASNTVLGMSLSYYLSEYEAGKLSRDESDIFMSMLRKIYNSNRTAQKEARAYVRFFVEADGVRYYVKLIRWSYEDGFMEWDNSSGKMTKPDITL